MEPEGSLPHSQVPATYPYPEPARPSPGTDIINRITQFYYAIINVAAHLQSSEKPGPLTDRPADITLLYCPVNTVTQAVHRLR